MMYYFHLIVAVNYLLCFLFPRKVSSNNPRLHESSLPIYTKHLWRQYVLCKQAACSRRHKDKELRENDRTQQIWD